MTDPGRDRWQKLQELFEAASGLAGEARDRLLRESCDGDAGLEAELRGLLDAAASTGALDVLGPRLTSIMDVLEDAPPERIGPYVVEGVAGRGGMGVVYRGFDPRLQRHVAIKLVARELLAEPGIRQRFVNEARLASALDHPNICTIYDIGTLPDDRTFLAMAYYGRGTLEERISAGPLPAEEATAVARQLAGALEAAHAAGIVHRDVKPRNIAFGERGEVRLLDFGVALLGQDGDAVGSTAGTPAYMAPEQVRGERVDARADVWALGVVLYEMLAGRRPFDGDRAAVLEAITTADPPPLLALRPDLPRELGAVVERAMRRNADARFATMREFETALTAAAAAEPAPAGPTGARARSSQWQLAAGVLLVALAGSAFVALRREAPPVALVPNETSAGAAESYLERGRRALHGPAEQWEAAVTLLRTATAREPDDAAARALLARALARTAVPGFAPALNVARLDSAEAELQAAIRLAPDLPDVEAARGTVARVRGHATVAMEHHARAVAMDSTQVLSMVELGELYFDANDGAATTWWLERAVRADPSLHGARALLAGSYRWWEFPHRARSHVAAGLELTPESNRLLWEGVQLEFVVGDTAAARDHLRAVTVLLMHFEQDRLTAWYEYMTGDVPAALPYVERIASALTHWFDLRMAGLVFVAAGDTARGHPLLREALAGITKQSSSMPTYLLHWSQAYTYAGLGERERAIRALLDWERSGGFRSWCLLHIERGWEPLRGDARFDGIVERTRATFRQRRAQILPVLRELDGPQDPPLSVDQPSC